MGRCTAGVLVVRLLTVVLLVMIVGGDVWSSVMVMVMMVAGVHATVASRESLPVRCPCAAVIEPPRPDVRYKQDHVQVGLSFLMDARPDRTFAAPPSPPGVRPELGRDRPTTCGSI